MERIRKFTDRLCLPTAQVAHHCQASTSALKGWIRGGWLAVCKTPAGHCRVELEERQRCLRQYGMPVCPSPALDIRILIFDDEPSVVDLFIGLLTGDPQGFKLDTATDRDRVVPGIRYAPRASDTPGREALATGESARGPEAMEAVEPGVPALVMTFTDIGIGITPEEMPKAMAPFFTTKEEGKETG